MHRRLMALVAASFLAIALIAAPGFARHNASPNSQATITFEDCLVESSKDISYIAYLTDGEQVDKDEDVDGESFDLTDVEGIEEFDAIEVKSGTTVESFAIDCVSGDTAGDDDGDERVRGNSAAVITLDDCLIQSSKDISYVEFFTDGDSVDKLEDVDRERFDLTGYDGIEDIDAVAVKAGTTVERFSVSCPPQDDEGGTDGDDVDEGDEDDPTTEPTEEPDEDDDVDEPDDGDGAVITLNGCTVESSKDISYVAYFSDGQFVEKDESMNSRTFDLNAVEGIEDFDAVEVKSSTTVERFAIDCGTYDSGDTAGDDVDDEPTEDPTEEPTDEPTEEPTDEPTEEPTEDPTEDEDSDGSDDEEDEDEEDDES